MSIQWVAIAGFLYFEIFIAALFIIPFISASRFLTRVGTHSTLYFNFLMMVLFVLFLDAIRETFKYSKMEENILENRQADSQSVILMRLFRSQRNLYVSGFAFFMWFVLGKMAALLSRVAQLEATNEAITKQAKGASDVAQKLMSDSNKPQAGDSSNKGMDIEKLETLLENKDKNVRKLEVNLCALKKQSDNTAAAYEELLKVNEELQKKLAKLEDTTVNKKDD